MAAGSVSGGNLAAFNGTVGLNLAVGQNIVDLAGIALPGSEPLTDQTYLLDNIAPGTVSFTRRTPANGSTNADTLVFRATFDGDVQNVNAADFAVTGTTATVTGVSMVDARTYDLTVSGGNLANLNATVGLDLGGTQDITDPAGNALPSTEPATDQAYLVDNAAPILSAFARRTPATSLTNADTLVFRAAFNEDVTAVNAADFAVMGTTATVTGVSAVDARTYDVTVSGGDLASLNATVGLNLNGTQNITDPAGNALPASEPATDETYIEDNDAPGLTSFTRQTPTNNPTNADTLVFRAAFDEDVRNVNAGDFAVAGTTTATITNVTPVTAGT